MVVIKEKLYYMNILSVQPEKEKLLPLFLVLIKHKIVLSCSFFNSNNRTV